MHTKISFKFQIISKFPAVKSCACLLQFPGTNFESSVVLINGAAWSAICETRRKDFHFLILIFSILVKKSYHGIAGRSFAVSLFSMAPM